MRNGATIPELILLLVLLGVFLGLSVSGTLAAREMAAARGARDAMAVIVARARLEAVERGSARIEVTSADGTVRIEAPAGTVVDRHALGRTFGVEVRVDGTRSPAIVLEFDGLGIGRLANRTFRFRRGAAEARLTLSSYGRPRRW